MTTKRPSRSKGRPVAALSGAAREALLDAAQDLFGRQGVAATPLSAVAKAAGVTTAMVHYYFSSRDQLLDALVEERIGPLMAHVWGPVEAGQGLEVILPGLVRRLVEGPGSKPWLPPLWIREVISEGGELRARVLQRLPRAKFQALAAAVAEGQGQGAVNPGLEPSLLALSVFGLVMLPMAMANLLHALPGAAGINPASIARHAEALLRNGIQSPKPTPRRRLA
ncbi:MAG: TetR/AcrR family transcriptional regulator [Acidobacteria bacterium]|nr:TetR/AcrR family transcriptional regulator [Acidobacteriota bacterium]